MADHHRADLHVAGHNDGSGFLIDRDPRLGGEHLNRQLLDSADEAVGMIALAGGNRDDDVLTVDGDGENLAVVGLGIIDDLGDSAGGSPTGGIFVENERELSTGVDDVGREIGFHDRPAGGGADHADRWRAGVFDGDRALGQRQQRSAGKRALHRRDEQSAAVQACGGANTGDMDIQMIAIPRPGAGTVAVTITTATLAALLSCCDRHRIAKLGEHGPQRRDRRREIAAIAGAL